MRCLFCDQSLSFLKTLKGDRFCTPEHSELFQQAQSKNAIDRLLEFVQINDSTPAPEPSPERTRHHGTHAQSPASSRPATSAARSAPPPTPSRVTPPAPDAAPAMRDAAPAVRDDVPPDAPFRMQAPKRQPPQGPSLQSPGEAVFVPSVPAPSLPAARLVPEHWPTPQQEGTEPELTELPFPMELPRRQLPRKLSTVSSGAIGPLGRVAIPRVRIAPETLIRHEIETPVEAPTDVWAGVPAQPLEILEAPCGLAGFLETPGPSINPGQPPVLRAQPPPVPRSMAPKALPLPIPAGSLSTGTPSMAEEMPFGMQFSGGNATLGKLSAFSPVISPGIARMGVPVNVPTIDPPRLREVGVVIAGGLETNGRVEKAHAPIPAIGPLPPSVAAIVHSSSDQRVSFKPAGLGSGAALMQAAPSGTATSNPPIQVSAAAPIALQQTRLASSTHAHTFDIAAPKLSKTSMELRTVTLTGKLLVLGFANIPKVEAAGPRRHLLSVTSRTAMSNADLGGIQAFPCSKVARPLVVSATNDSRTQLLVRGLSGPLQHLQDAKFVTGLTASPRTPRIVAGPNSLFTLQVDRARDITADNSKLLLPSLARRSERVGYEASAAKFSLLAARIKASRRTVTAPTGVPLPGRPAVSLPVTNSTAQQDLVLPRFAWKSGTKPQAAVARGIRFHGKTSPVGTHEPERWNQPTHAARLPDVGIAVDRPGFRRELSNRQRELQRPLDAGRASSKEVLISGTSTNPTRVRSWSLAILPQPNRAIALSSGLTGAASYGPMSILGQSAGSYLVSIAHPMTPQQVTPRIPMSQVHLRTAKPMASVFRHIHESSMANSLPALNITPRWSPILAQPASLVVGPRPSQPALAARFQGKTADMRFPVSKGPSKAPQPQIHLQPLLSFTPRVEFAFDWTPSASLQRVSVLQSATVFPAGATNFKPALALTTFSTPRIALPATPRTASRLETGSLSRETLTAVGGELRTAISSTKSTVGILGWMSGNIRIQSPSVERRMLAAHLEPRKSVVESMYVGVGPARVDARKAIPRRGVLAMPVSETPRFDWISGSG
jgi:hypothetical protein